jgi:DNA-binding NarL/FixJ family response regulator
MFRVLCIDGHPDIQELIRSLIRVALPASPCHVDAAHTGAEARGLLRTFHYDVIVLDLNVSDQSPLTLCAHIRACDSDVRILPYSWAPSIPELAHFRCEPLVAKSAPISDLIAAIRAVVPSWPAMSAETIHEAPVYEGAVALLAGTSQARAHLYGLLQSFGITPSAELPASSLPQPAGGNTPIVLGSEGDIEQLIAIAPHLASRPLMVVFPPLDLAGISLSQIRAVNCIARDIPAFDERFLYALRMTSQGVLYCDMRPQALSYLVPPPDNLSPETWAVMIASLHGWGDAQIAVELRMSLDVVALCQSELTLRWRDRQQLMRFAQRYFSFALGVIPEGVRRHLLAERLQTIQALHRVSDFTGSLR